MWGSRAGDEPRCWGLTSHLNRSVGRQAGRQGREGEAEEGEGEVEEGACAGQLSAAINPPGLFTASRTYEC